MVPPLRRSILDGPPDRCGIRTSTIFMALRIRGLAPLDPRVVQLPVGTEVTTCIDRSVGDRIVPQGAVGRVAGVGVDTVDVNLVGVGLVRYNRGEVLARKVGQVRYAQRRHDAWESLHGCVVLSSTVGSRAWGLDSPSSDHDIRGVFALPSSWAFGLVNPPDTLVSADGSTTYWEVGKAIRQALRADPNTLEMLFVDDTRVHDEVGQWILDARDAFVSTEIYGSFGRYALSQLKRLDQASQLAEIRDLVLTWLREEPTMAFDEVAARLAVLDPRASPTLETARLRARESVKQLYRSLYDQGLIGSRDFHALAEYARAASASLDLSRDLRPKNAYNLVRLIVCAIDWLATGKPQLRLTGVRREQLLAIKEGKVSLDVVLAVSEALTAELEDARVSSTLPARADIGRIDALLHRIRNELASRWANRCPGPWGANAPPAPPACWDDEY